MWTVLFGDLFDAWQDEQEDGLQEKVLADMMNLRTFGPALSGPYADTVNGYRHKNMKELRVQYGGTSSEHSLHLIRPGGPSSFVPVIRVMTRNF